MKTLIELGSAVIHHRIKRLSENLAQDVLKFYKEFFPGIEPASLPLLFSIQLNGESSVKEIADSIGTSHPAVVQFVKRLELKNLITLNSTNDDRRKKIVSLSEKGKELLASIKPYQKDIETAVLKFGKETGIDLTVILDQIESTLVQKSFYSRIKSVYKERAIKDVEVLVYNKKYKDNFRDLNYEWLNKYFEVEPVDEKVLSNPEKEIIKKGGEIFFARVNGEIVGTCAAIKIDKEHYELAKMAVSEKAQGKQAGKKLALAVIGFAWSKKAKYLSLLTSSKLVSAVHLYKNLGFETVQFNEPTNYKRKVFKMVLEL